MCGEIETCIKREVTTGGRERPSRCEVSSARRRAPWARNRAVGALLLTSSATSATAAAAAAASSAPETADGIVAHGSYPPLTLFERDLLTTARADFEGNAGAFAAATHWSQQLLSGGQEAQVAPHLACAQDGNGRSALSRLQNVFGGGGTRAVTSASFSTTTGHGACFIATASHAQASAIMADPAEYGLASIGPFPSMLKLAPGLLEHPKPSQNIAAEPEGEKEITSKIAKQDQNGGRLATTHGHRMKMKNVEGLTVELSPGVLPAHDFAAGQFINELLEGLMSDSLDLHASNFWSDPTMLEGESGHLTRPEGALRAREWTRAAEVVHNLSSSAGEAASAPSPGEICSWDGIFVHHADNDILLVSGMDHLLFSGRGAGGRKGEEASELHVACFMGLLSVLAAKPEVLRIEPRHRMAPLNAAARANIQSATVTDTPLSDAGLDGSGEIIQVLDTGLDYSSCFFVDSDGEEVAHGHYFEEVGFSSSAYYAASSTMQVAVAFDGGDFHADLTRRKLVQYINLVRSDAGSEGSAHGESYVSADGVRYPWVSAEDFEADYAAGHGTHTAGSAAGSILSSTAELATCDDDKVLGCVGGCIDESSLGSDDLVSYFYQNMAQVDLDRLCPAFDCDGLDSIKCLGDDPTATLTEHGGMATGAKLAIFDIFYGDFTFGSFLAGNGLWEPPLEIGAKLHSNSWGGNVGCVVSTEDVLFDDFMYQNPENLLIFAAGNDGDPYGGSDDTACTIGSPAIAKNVLSVGASSSGETRITATGTDGQQVDEPSGNSDIDTVAFFSSYGPAFDGRIKPEVVAPGDQIYSAASDGTTDYSCRLWMYAGTSMSCPIVAGGAAMVRQYFINETFYADDVTTRGFCGEPAGSAGTFLCDGFAPSAATVKAILINSANLMGKGSEPDGYRGFGRIHLEAGMPIKGTGDMALFVADAQTTSITELTRHEYVFNVDGAAGIEFRATISWIDPATSPYAATQLLHDLDLAVISPSGTRYTMWRSGEVDKVNVNERVIVSAGDVSADSGMWTIWVWAKGLTTDVQAYSLAVTGAISPASSSMLSNHTGWGLETSTSSKNSNGVDTEGTEVTSSACATSGPGVLGSFAVSAAAVIVSGVVYSLAATV